MTAKTVRNLALATLFLAGCLSSGCAEQPSPQSTNNDDVITPEYSPQDGGGGGGGSTQTCVLAGLTPGATYELSYEVQQPGGGGYTAVRQETANALGEVPFPNVPVEIDCHAIKVTPLATPTPQPPIAGMPPEGE